MSAEEGDYDLLNPPADPGKPMDPTKVTRYQEKKIVDGRLSTILHSLL